MTYAEAATLSTKTHRTRNTSWFMFTFVRDGAEKSLGTSMSADAGVRFVLARVAAEIERRSG
jgi:hypothetical protein